MLSFTENDGRFHPFDSSGNFWMNACLVSDINVSGLAFIIDCPIILYKISSPNPLAGLSNCHAEAVE
jgi:hypothetical protein